MSSARMTDEELVAVIRGEMQPTPDQLRDAAGELHHRRKVGREYGRRAKEVERLRWACELLVAKVEALSTRIAQEDATAAKEAVLAAKERADG